MPSSIGIRQALISPNVNGCGFYYEARPIHIELVKRALAGKDLANALIRLFNGG